MPKKIALCGANAHWHRSLLECIGQLCHSSTGIVHQSFVSYGTIELQIAVGGMSIQLVSLQNAMLYERLAVNHLLKGVDGIIYLIGSRYPANRDVMYGAGDQQRQFQTYRHYAQAMGLDWQSLPVLWVLVTNIPDLFKPLRAGCVTDNPLAKVISLHQSPMELDLSNTVQVQQVWRAALTLCGIAAEGAE